MVNFIKKHSVILLVLFNIIIIAIAAGIIINHKSKTATINILVSPFDATITLNGKAYENGEYDIKPGEYHVEISKEGLESKSLNFEIKKGEYYRIYEYLTNQDGSFSYYNSEERAYDAVLLEDIAKFKDDKDLNSYLAARKKELAILSSLPIVFEDYTNDYNDYIKYSIEINRTENCPKILCLKIIDINGTNEEAALNEIRSRGYDPADYGIEYIHESL